MKKADGESPKSLESKVFSYISFIHFIKGEAKPRAGHGPDARSVSE